MPYGIYKLDLWVERARPKHQTFGGLLKQDDFCTKSHEVFPLKKECCRENIGFYFKVVEFGADGSNKVLS